jgi:hypothetical protein
LVLLVHLLDQVCAFCTPMADDDDSTKMVFKCTIIVDLFMMFSSFIMMVVFDVKLMQITFVVLREVPWYLFMY